MINFFTEGLTFALPQRKATTQWLHHVVQQEGYTLGELNYIFCTDAYLHALNVQYLRHDTLTDVITFDHAEAPHTAAGDVYISLERVRANAQAYGQPFVHELYTVMVHGVLHLLGYDDKTPDDQALMRHKEAIYVAQRRPTAATDKKKTIES